MKRIRLLFFPLAFCMNAFSQQQTLQGKISDNANAPLPYATVALLHPADSTMAYFGISGDDGSWLIKNVSSGNYLFQASFLGYKTFYSLINVPGNISAIEAIKLSAGGQSISEVNITGERIPVRIKQDTIEYDAGAYKTKPDAVAEDLLKKLPGVEVDRSGNIKAQGEQITNVLVDGKEFFSNDPKVATKNLPADAIDKVQIYDKKSDQAEMTGIDDGEREKTINLMLKDNKKSALFGELTAGAGTDEHYKLSSKLYRFTPKQQFAFLGMLNNINESGFSFKDYLDFSGGMRNMGDGNMGFTFNSGALPVNFGETENGLITSGGVGLNYTYEPVKNNRINISYMANGSNKEERDNIYTENFTGEQKYFTLEDNEGNSRNRNHNATINWRNRPDSTQNIQLNGTLTLNTEESNTNSYSRSYTEIGNENELTDHGNEDNDGLSGKLRAAYLKRWNSKWSVFKISGDASVNSSLTNSEWQNISRFFTSGITNTENNFRDNTTARQSYTSNVSITRKTGKYHYLEPAVEAGTVIQTLEREEGIMNVETPQVKYDFVSNYLFLRPSLAFKYNKEKKHFLLSLRTEFLQLSHDFENENIYTKGYFYFIPRINWENEYRTGRRYNINYNTRINQPSVTSLLPVPNDRNPLVVSFGNPMLKPEYLHNLRLNWNVFDQFSFTSFMSGINLRYTQDKVTWKTNINEDLTRMQIPVNSGDDFLAELYGEVTTPIRKLKINITLEGSESYNRGITIINDANNITESYTHAYSLTIENRKKEKLDASIGVRAAVTNSNYSIEKDPASYLTLTYFGEVSYRFNDNWFFSATGDISSYQSQSFKDKTIIPLVSAQVSRYFLTGKRLALTLQAYDIINQNTGIERVSELNYIREKKSDIIDRFVMLSIKYRLNKADRGGSDMKIDIR